MKPLAKSQANQVARQIVCVTITVKTNCRDGRLEDAREI